MVEILYTPERGSPKSQCQDNIDPPPFVSERSVNCTDCVVQLVPGKPKSATGEGMLLIICSTKLVQESEVVTVNLTTCESAVPANVWDTFGLAGARIVTEVPSPKSQTHFTMLPKYPGGVVERSVYCTTAPRQFGEVKLNAALDNGFTRTGLIVSFVHPLELTIVSFTLNIPLMA
jgi:hypothetical protein